MLEFPLKTRSASRRIIVFACVALLSMALARFAGAAQSEAETFYSGKTVRIIVGFTPGGFYDRWARLLSRYMPKYIPGTPNFLVQNMPGASSVIAANYVFNLAKNDGLTLLVPINSLYLDQVVGRKEVRFDVRKFVFIGTQEKAPTLLYFRAAIIGRPKSPPRRITSATLRLSSAVFSLSKIS